MPHKIKNESKEVRKTLAERVLDEIAESIINGELSPGSHISEPLMAERYGISRGPLREALHRLQERRLVTRQAHLGARVANVSRVVLQQLFLVRESLEGLAAREAAVHATEEEIEHIYAAVPGRSATGNAAKSHRSTVSPDAGKDFHAAISRAAHNPILNELLCCDIYDLTRFYRSQVRDLPGRRERAIIEHRRILEAIVEHDPEMAELQMRRHIAAAREGLEASLPVDISAKQATAQKSTTRRRAST
jgi:DNA-binding GntR family transcriptional regulator